MFKRPARLVLFCCLSLGLLSCGRIIPQQQLPAPFQILERSTVIAHRGGAHLRPENTIPAFDHAVELGAHALELDLHLSRDQELVVIHDFSVQRTTNGQGQVAEMDLKQLKNLDAGYHFSPYARPGEYPYRGRGIEIPTLREVLQRYPQTVLCLDIKPNNPSIADLLAELLLEFGRLNTTIIASFEHDILQQVRRVLPEAVTSASGREMRRLSILHRWSLSRFYTSGGQVLRFKKNSGLIQGTTQEALIRQARDSGFLVHVWTVNRKEAMHTYLNLGVNGIITDRPDLLLQVLDHRRKLP